MAGGRREIKSLYVLFTADKLELPLCVGTANEIAEYLNTSYDTVICNACRGTVNRKHNARVKKIGEYSKTDPLINI